MSNRIAVIYSVILVGWSLIKTDSDWKISLVSCSQQWGLVANGLKPRWEQDRGPISPTVFISYRERAMDTTRENRTGVSLHGHLINNHKFADDIDLLEEDRDVLQENVERWNEAWEAAGLQINIEKTVTLVFGQEDITKELVIRSKKIENVTEFVYLGSLLTWDNDCNKEIKSRVARATAAMVGFQTIWNSEHISLKTKLTSSGRERWMCW